LLSRDNYHWETVSPQFHFSLLEIVENILIESFARWSALCIGNCMPTTRSAALYERPLRFARRALEYAVAMSVALLCSYWIVQARW
jgi:hypothetical protein